jgi:hypothetical protein
MRALTGFCLPPNPPEFPDSARFYGFIIVAVTMATGLQRKILKIM